MIDHLRFQQLTKSLYGTVEELELMFPGRHFTPDGHMVGSIGECLVADAYNLELQPASNKGFDAISSLGQEVEIKATQSNRVAFRHAPQFAIVIRIFPDGNFEEIYNGPGRLIWDLFVVHPRAIINRWCLMQCVASLQAVHRVRQISSVDVR